MKGSFIAKKGMIRRRKNAGFDKHSGQVRIEMKGLAELDREFAHRISPEDLNEVITASVQAKTAIETDGV